MGATNADGSSAVVITGASTGIGAACALDLAARGWRVFAGVRKSADGDAMRAKSPDGVEPVLLDVTDPLSIGHAARFVTDAVGPAGLAGLVNNAGMAVTGPLEALPIAALRNQFEVNVFGQIAVTQAFLPLVRQCRGRIVNMGSIAGRATTPMMGPYCASKFALESLTDALRLELQPWGIHVSIIEPGAIATPLWDKSKRASVELEAATAADMVQKYAEVAARIREAVAEAEQRAISPDAVVKAVRHALTAPRPRTRYLVGNDATIRALMQKLLPDRLHDRLLTWFLKLPREAR
jgi:NAD(P)-dependent dehydrogenase (short-subunit alcohol dehydrogenase family)